ncbi:MarR family winged helix-turn-helix transcriptional regulator [Christensenella tenuis]|jgi:DNA-binding MarR family transcriptional regulator|uniref:Winged helix-turn-helix transcriptional regulator n=1 Tax=Christensenella tenuis TaxID=2763033 RepID=A0ABR7EF62_9FIRM|nr:MarR family winged helix-turn-helix transcriptional regulator [Christensenella tenuis]MBC5648401.1 winged helix-turn-helix transcriptional regulator [Christensenella tenuis]
MTGYDEKHLRPLLYLSRKLKKLYERECAKAAAPFGLSQGEADVLLFLSNNPGFDTAMDVVKYRSVSKALVSKAVESLSARGYLTLHTDRRDRRYTHLVLTEAAAPALRAVLGAQAAFVDLLKSETTPEERAVISAVFERLCEKLETV